MVSGPAGPRKATLNDSVPQRNDVQLSRKLHKFPVQCVRKAGERVTCEVEAKTLHAPHANVLQLAKRDPRVWADQGARGGELVDKRQLRSNFNNDCPQPIEWFLGTRAW